MPQIVSCVLLLFSAGSVIFFSYKFIPTLSSFIRQVDDWDAMLEASKTLKSAQSYVDFFLFGSKFLENHTLFESFLVCFWVYFGFLWRPQSNLGPSIVLVASALVTIASCVFFLASVYLMIIATVYQ